MNKQKLPKGWKEVELGEVFDFQKKSKIKAGEGSKKGKYKFFTSSDKQTKFIDEYNQDGEYLIFATGGHAGIHYCNEKFATSTDCFIVKVDDRVLTKYIYYYLFSKIQLLEEGFKGAGLKHISKGYLQYIKLFYPENKETQKAIVSILEKAEKAKEWRKEADDLTKDFLKSVFLEMFGDRKKFETIKLESLTSKVSSGSTPLGGRDNYLDNGEILFIRSQNVLMNKFSKHDKLYISQEIHENMKRTWIKNLDVLLNITGASIGRTAVYYGEDDKANVNQHVCIIRVKDFNELNPVYLNYYLSSNVIQRYIEKINTGGTREALNYTQIKNFDLVLPPISLQNKFASIVKEVEKLKEHQKKSKQDLDNLFNALMQKAFRGKLVV